LALGIASGKDPAAISLHLLPPTAPTASSTRASGDTVLLLHGLCRSHHAMVPLARRLADAGYAVVNCGYPSRTADIPALAETLHLALAPILRDAPRVHVVTHSMGGILLRTLHQRHPLPNLGRVVMLAPPNGGSEVVDRLGALAPFGWINGPAGRQLGTDPGSLPARLAPPDFELGVIAGDRSVNPLLSLLIPGRDDGKVAVARTRLPGMRDFICLHATHPFIMRNPRVLSQTTHFLKNGRFMRPLRLPPSTESAARSHAGTPKRREHTQTASPSRDDIRVARVTPCAFLTHKPFSE